MTERKASATGLGGQSNCLQMATRCARVDPAPATVSPILQGHAEGWGEPLPYELR